MDLRSIAKKVNNYAKWPKDHNNRSSTRLHNAQLHMLNFSVPGVVGHQNEGLRDNNGVVSNSPENNSLKEQQ